MKPERALFTADPLTTTAIQEFDRIYQGAEFCPWRFPSLHSLQQALDFAHSRSLPFTLVTPVLAEGLLPRLRTTLHSILPRFSAADEVVISDWGGLALVREIAPQVTLVLGRTLSGQKRGPQIMDLDLPPAQLDYFRQAAWSSRPALDLLADVGISRVELDLPPQGISSLPRGLSGSLHTPFAMVASSRNCPFRPGTGENGCPAPCGEIFVLSSPQSRLPLYQAGNTQFLRIDLPDPTLFPPAIDRLVIHTHLPR